MIRQYQHTQIGYLTIIAIGIPMFFIIRLIDVYGYNWIPWFVFIILGICLVLFAALTITIETDFIEIRFGIGIIRKKFLLKDIESYRVVKNPWYYGWGIRLTPHGWLFNVSGFYAIELKMKSGKKYRIGTDVPNQLEKAIGQVIEKRL